MVKIGWLADQVGIVGGAELSGQMLVNQAPDWAEIEFCPQSRRPPDDIEVWMLQNVVTYGQRWTEPLSNGAPLIKHFRDPWHQGDVIFRRWVLDHASMVIFNSPMAADHCPWPIPFGVRKEMCPPPVDIAAFERAALPDDEREGNVFVGRVDFNKGIHRAIDWALVHDKTLDVYGPGRLNVPEQMQNQIAVHGPVPYAEMPGIFGRAKRFVFLPAGEESYSRTTVEAWAAGCELVIDKSKIGAWRWIAHAPEQITMKVAVNRFWGIVEGVIQ
jgi:glycosyltransferase involved in cell wall biosynthesis